MIRRHLRRLLLALFACLTVVGLFDGAARAQDEEGLVIRAQVREQQRDETGKTDNQPVAGVTITVLDADGNEVGSALTDENGAVDIAVPARADYVVRLDEETLPDEQSIASNSSAEQAVTRDSFVTKARVVNFFTGESQRAEQGGVERVSQRIADGIRLGLVIAMCAVGLSLIFGTTGLTNFAHGEMVTFGGMMAFLLNVTGLGFLGTIAFLPFIDDDGRVHLLVAAPMAIALGGVFGWLLNWGIFARLRRRGIGLISQMVITVGLSILLRNAFLFQFRGRSRPLRDYSLQEGVEIGPVTITPRDLIIMALSVIVLVAVALALQYTRLGKATRAVSDNPDLASATGIDSQKVIRIVWIVAGGLAALGGVFRALDEQVAFDMGGRLLFLMFAAITLGGLGNAFGALVGGLVVGIFVEVSTLVVPTELKTTPALLILILTLLFRPQGILGKAQRVG